MRCVDCLGLPLSLNSVSIVKTTCVANFGGRGTSTAQSPLPTTFVGFGLNGILVAPCEIVKVPSEKDDERDYCDYNYGFNHFLINFNYS